MGGNFCGLGKNKHVRGKLIWFSVLIFIVVQHFFHKEALISCEWLYHENNKNNNPMKIEEYTVFDLINVPKISLQVLYFLVPWL